MATWQTISTDLADRIEQAEVDRYRTWQRLSAELGATVAQARKRAEALSRLDEALRDRRSR